MEPDHRTITEKSSIQAKETKGAQVEGSRGLEEGPGMRSRREGCWGSPWTVPLTASSLFLVGASDYSNATLRQPSNGVVA